MGQLVPLIALAASAAGAGLEINAASNETSQMNQAESAALAQQNQFSKQAQKVVNPNIQRSTAPAAQTAINQGAADQLAKYAQFNSQPTTTAASATPENRVTAAEGGANTTAQQEAAAKLAGYGSWQNAQSISNQQAANQLGVINTESAGWGPVLSSQLSQAQGSGAQEAGIGSLLSSAGGIAGSYGAASPYLNALKSYLNNANYSSTYGSGLPNNWQDQGGSAEGTAIGG